jgi:hypothetical protein
MIGGRPNRESAENKNSSGIDRQGLIGNVEAFALWVEISGRAPSRSQVLGTQTHILICQFS